MYLIIIFLLLIFPSSFASEGFSSPEILGRNKKTTLLSNATVIEENIIKTVIANGYGTSINTALQNATENALTQVVGSFINAETQIIKQKEIRDGVIKQTKLITKDIQDYSQGSIKNLEILNIQQNDSIFIVTAKINVRVEDFKTYIKELAFESKKINQGLFASIKTDEDNIENKLDLLGKIIDPLITGEVVDINIGSTQRLENLSVFGCVFKQQNNQINCNNGEYIYTNNFSLKGTLVIPITLNLNEDYLKNTIKILDNISEHKHNKIGKFEKIDYNTTLFNVRNDYTIHIFDSKLNSYIRYIIPQSRTYNEQRLPEKQIPVNAYQGTYCSRNFPNIRVQLLNVNKEAVWQKDFASCYSSIENFKNNAKNKNNLYFLRNSINNIKPYGKLYSDATGTRGYPTIFKQSQMLLLIEPSNDIINSVQEITIQYIQK